MVDARMSDLRAGDIRLMSKADLQLRVRELLDAETRYVETMERLTKRIADLEWELCAREGRQYDAAEQAHERREEAEMNRLDRERAHDRT